ncbi:MAG: tRNA (guanosine(46)-N7)-methyltransferase TrmB [Spirochaetota bacterium]
MSYFFDLNHLAPPPSRQKALKFFWCLFGNNNPLVVEIGSGNGHFLTEYAALVPEHNFIGTEILGGRARKFHSKVEKRRLGNVAIIKGDARRFVWEFLYKQMVEEFITMFPDPWPKKRHHKKRLIQVPLVNMLKTRLVHHGSISIVTDHSEYRDWIIQEFEKAGGFSSRFRQGYTSYPHSYYPQSLFEKRFRDQKKSMYVMEYRKTKN